MARRKKKLEEPQEEQPVVIQPTEEEISLTCSQDYDMEEAPLKGLIVDSTTLGLMLSGAFRPFQKYDQVNIQVSTIPQGKEHFSLFLAYRALRPGGLLWIRPEWATLRMFQDCKRDEIGGMVRVTKNKTYSGAS